MSPLRLALLLGEARQPRWVARIIETLEAAPYLTIAAVLMTPRPAAAPGPFQWLYQALDARLFGATTSPFELLDVRALLLDRPLRDAAAPEQPWDVILSFVGPAPEAASWARFGVWFHSQKVGDDATTRLGLYAQLEEQAPRLLFQSLGPRDPYSLIRSRAALAWKAVGCAPRVLEALHEEGPALLENAPEESLSNSDEYPHAPWAFGGRVARRAVEKLLRRDQWFLAFKEGPYDPLVDSPRGFEPLYPSPDRSWADPFPIEHRGRVHVFLEELSRRGRGHISVMVRDGGGRWSAPEPVLEQQDHLSYPHVFRWRDALFMCPETAERRRVELYRCVSFPSEWRLEAVLLEDVQAVDPSIIEHDGRWFLFCNIAAPGASTLDELHLFHAASPLGPWSAHRQNPIRSDVRCARPAGRLFKQGGALYRPAQDCALRYGHAISLNQVQILTPQRYQERERRKILPDWQPGLLGTHTLNQCGDLTFIDGFRRPWRWRLRASPGRSPLDQRAGRS